MKAFARAGRVAVLLMAGGLIAACSKGPSPAPARPIKFYQSPMHPWITSEQPGNCTICGMALVPVYADAPPGPEPSAGDLTLHADSLRALGVRTTPVRRGELRLTRNFSGIFEDDDNRHRVIAAFYDGRIERVYVDHVGQYVKRGEPLVAIYSPDLLYVVRELQTASQRGDTAVAASSARRLVQFGLSPDQVNALAKQREPAYTVDLLAPADGTILVRRAYEGQYLKTGEPLFETGDLARLWFHAEVYERDLPAIRVGEPATVTTPAVPGRTFPGTVTFVDPNFDAKSRSTKVRVEVDNPRVEGGRHGQRYLLPHRAFGEVEIRAELGGALLVPRSALLRDGRRSVVYVEKSPGRYEPRAVVVGRTGDDDVEITAGLTEGERVVTAGNLMIDAEAELRGSLAEPAK